AKARGLAISRTRLFLEIRFRQLIGNLGARIDEFYDQIEQTVGIAGEAFHKLGVLIRTHFRELIVEQVNDVVRISLESGQGILEVPGIDAPLLLKTLLYLLGGYDA